MWKRHKGKIIAGVIVLAVAGFMGSSIYKKRNQATEVSVAKVKVQDVVGKVIARVPVDKYLEVYEKARAGTK